MEIRKSNFFIGVVHKCKPIYYYISAEHGKSLKYLLLQETASWKQDKQMAIEETEKNKNGLLYRSSRIFIKEYWNKVLLNVFSTTLKKLEVLF